jgi:hypothetical protein
MVAIHDVDKVGGLLNQGLEAGHEKGVAGLVHPACILKSQFDENFSSSRTPPSREFPLDTADVAAGIAQAKVDGSAARPQAMGEK